MIDRLDSNGIWAWDNWDERLTDKGFEVDVLWADDNDGVDMLDVVPICVWISQEQIVKLWL